MFSFSVLCLLVCCLSNSVVSTAKNAKNNANALDNLNYVLFQVNQQVSSLCFQLPIHSFYQYNETLDFYEFHLVFAATDNEEIKEKINECAEMTRYNELVTLLDLQQDVYKQLLLDETQQVDWHPLFVKQAKEQWKQFYFQQQEKGNNKDNNKENRNKDKSKGKDNDKKEKDEELEYLEMESRHKWFQKKWKLRLETLDVVFSSPLRNSMKNMTSGVIVLVCALIICMASVMMFTAFRFEMNRKKEKLSRKKDRQKRHKQDQVI